jgi:hypothetical protein
VRPSASRSTLIAWPWAVGLGLALVGLIVLAFWLAPTWFVPEGDLKSEAEVLTAENQVRTAGLQVIAGLVVASGLLLTARSVALTARSIEVNREGQVTERFSRSVEQLGHESQEVRIGGMYALERIANESEPDRETVLEVLAAYAREHARPPTSAESRIGPNAAEAAEPGQTRPQDGSERLRADIAAIVNVLRRWKWPHAELVDLRKSYLAYGNFFEANLSRASLVEANLVGAILTEANLSGALMLMANLSDAILLGVDLSGSRLQRANLSGASLLNANLSRADLSSANLTRSKLSEADLSDANLAGANLSGADLSGTDLSNARLLGARYTRETVLPIGFNPRDAGMILIHDGSE